MVRILTGRQGTSRFIISDEACTDIDPENRWRLPLMPTWSIAKDYRKLQSHLLRSRLVPWQSPIYLAVDYGSQPRQITKQGSTATASHWLEGVGLGGVPRGSSGTGVYWIEGSGKESVGSILVFSNVEVSLKALFVINISTIWCKLHIIGNLREMVKVEGCLNNRHCP